MTHAEFVVGGEFQYGGQVWRCTDKGGRTVVALCIQPWRDAGWFTGPPYASQEIVFDEDDLPACTPYKTGISK